MVAPSSRSVRATAGAGCQGVIGVGAKVWRWVRPGRVAWLTFLVIWGGLSALGAPVGPAMVPAAVCALANLVLLSADARREVPDIPDTVPASWSGLDDPHP